MKYTFKASEVRCNGIGGAGFQEAMKSKDLIKRIVEEVREKIGTDAIFEKIVAENPRDDFYAGRRFTTVDDVVSRLATGLGNWSFDKLGSKELVEMNVRAILETISEDDSITIVIDAHRDCAGADHWYEFEKDWG
jgi:hypothetical protein